MNKEVFKEISFTHGKYSVSNKGSVRNNHIDSEVAQFEYHNGYLGVCLYVDGKHYNRRVHRLVAEAFIPCNNCSLQINHKDENKKNNSLDNLEWCTHKYNMNSGTVSQRIGNGNRGKIRSPEQIQKYRNQILLYLIDILLVLLFL